MNKNQDMNQNKNQDMNQNKNQQNEDKRKPKEGAEQGRPEQRGQGAKAGAVLKDINGDTGKESK